MCPAEGCVFVKGHGGDHFTPEDGRDHSDEIRLRILRDKIADLEAQLAEARKDSERLDWLGQNDTSWARIAWRVSGPGCVEIKSISPDGKQFHPSLREAIDAAMEKKL